MCLEMQFVALVGQFVEMLLVGDVCRFDLALAAVADWVSPDEAGRWGDTNGAAMRITPVGIATPVEPLDGLCAAVARASRLTHNTGVAISGAAAVAGLNLGGVETMIALAGVVLGLCVLLAARPPLWVAMAIVAVFAVFHGYAHGKELPEAVNPASYAVGFVVGTGLLHLVGVAVGLLWRWRAGRIAVRAAGAAIALAGAAFLTGFA